MNLDDVKLEVIRAENLQHGDFILVSCPESDIARVTAWADLFFAKYAYRVGVIPDSMTVRVISPEKEKE